MANNKNEFNISASWDPEAHDWVAVSDDIPRLVAEARSPQKLIVKLQVLVRELCELNGHLMKVPLSKMSISTDYDKYNE